MTGRRILEALPLIQATWPDIDLPTWRSFVKSFTAKHPASSSGALALLDGSGGLCGVLAYCQEFDLCEGPTLAVRLFSAVDLRNATAPARALLDAAMEQARRHGCHGIHIRLKPEQAALARSIQSLGVSHAAGLYRIDLDPIGAPN